MKLQGVCHAEGTLSPALQLSQVPTGSQTSLHPHGSYTSTDPMSPTRCLLYPVHQIQGLWVWGTLRKGFCHMHTPKQRKCQPRGHTPRRLGSPAAPTGAHAHLYILRAYAFQIPPNLPYLLLFVLLSHFSLTQILEGASCLKAKPSPTHLQGQLYSSTKVWLLHYM